MFMRLHQNRLWCHNHTVLEDFFWNCDHNCVFITVCVARVQRQFWSCVKCGPRLKIVHFLPLPNILQYTHNILFLIFFLVRLYCSCGKVKEDRAVDLIQCNSKLRLLNALWSIIYIISYYPQRDAYSSFHSASTCIYTHVDTYYVGHHKSFF